MLISLILYFSSISVNITASDAVLPAFGVYIRHIINFLDNYFDDFTPFITALNAEKIPASNYVWHRPSNTVDPLTQLPSVFVLTVDIWEATVQFPSNLHLVTDDTPTLRIRKLLFYPSGLS